MKEKKKNNQKSCGVVHAFIQEKPINGIEIKSNKLWRHTKIWVNLQGITLGEKNNPKRLHTVQF